MRAERTRTDRASVRASRAVARMRVKRAQTENATTVKYRRTTPFSYSPRCIRAYPLSILGQVFTLASSERRYVRRTSDHGDRVRRRRDRPNPSSMNENARFFLKSNLLTVSQSGRCYLSHYTLSR